MVQYITTPWRTRSSLFQVRDALYPPPTSALSPEETASRCREAISRVSIWAQRGNCPHLVESTALLSAAILNDDPRNEAWCVRAAYASSFSRFVTGFLDSHQTAKRKISMYALARTLDLPATYVELRHQATHEELPSLQRLRGAARKALAWIWERYWADLSLDPEGGEGREGEEDLRRVVERVVREGDGERGWQRLKGGEWEEERVLRVLMDMQEEEGGERDSGVLLRAVRLSRMVLSGDGASDVPENTGRSIEEIRRELAAAKERLDEEGDEVVRRDQTGSIHIADNQAEGWAMWEGPWTPTPIGTVHC